MWAIRGSIRRVLGCALLSSVGAGVAVALVMTGGSGDAFDPGDLAPAIAERYRFVSENADLVGQIPCYCGCMPGLDHESLKDCYLTASDQFTPHASRCGICLGEAWDLEGMAAQGFSWDAMRDYIDDTYASAAS